MSFASTWTREKREEIHRIQSMLSTLVDFADAVPKPWRCVISENSSKRNGWHIFECRLINNGYSIVPVLLTVRPGAKYCMIKTPFLGGSTEDDLTELRLSELKTNLEIIFNHEKIKALYASKAHV